VYKIAESATQLANFILLHHYSHTAVAVSSCYSSQQLQMSVCV